MKEYIEKINELAEERSFGEFAWMITEGIQSRKFSLNDLEQLLSELFRQYIRTSDTNFDEYHCYINLCGVYADFCCFVTASLRKMLCYHQVVLQEGKIILGEQVLDFQKIRQTIYSLKESMNPEEFEEGLNDVNLWLDELTHFESDEWSMENALIEKIDKENAAVVISMLDYLRRFRSPEELKRRQRFVISEYTREEMKNLHARIIQSTYCYIFSDLANWSECEHEDEALDKIKAAKNEKEFVIAVAESDIWLRNWSSGYPLLPYDAYMFITQDDYQVSFRSEEGNALDAESSTAGQLHS